MAKIVVLEDDTATRRLICAVLKKAGHEVTDVDNGAEGLLIVMAEQPDLVISDVEMPKMTGFEVLQNVRLEPDTADTPFILLTSLASRADIRKGMVQGADDYITKPFEPQELIESVNAQMARLAHRRGQKAQLPSTAMALAGQISATTAEPPALVLALTPDQAVKVPCEPFISMQAQSVPAVPEPSAIPGSSRRHIDKAWAVNMVVQNQEQLQAALPAKDWRLLLRQLFVPGSKNATLRAADYLDMNGGSLTLYFVDQNQAHAEHRPSSASLAAMAVEAMVQAAADCKIWAATQFKAPSVPPVRVLINLHLGPIEVHQVAMEFGGERSSVVGATAEYICGLRQGEPRVMWRVLATGPALQESAGLYKLGASMQVSVGRQEHAVHAVHGLVPGPGMDLPYTPADWI